jgi:lipopolysaccharide biosynthesis protein
MRFVAFYLPQFHPTPLNDAQWGPGFTEWTNVSRATPRFRGHYQPHLPADLGFYDLRLPEVRDAQAQLAAAYGIDAFCYYHFWFDGERELQRPFAEVLSSGEPRFPFCLCWANENWTRVWDGGDREVIRAQRYSEQDDLRHIRWLSEAFADPRYLRVSERPLFLIYKASGLPNPERTVDTWRNECRRLGVADPFLCRVDSWNEQRTDPRSLGFDAAVEFLPDMKLFGPRLYRRLPLRAIRKYVRPSSGVRIHKLFDYAQAVDLALSQPASPYPRFRCVLPGWDNSPRRRSDAHILVGSTPAAYQRLVEGVTSAALREGGEDTLVFVNAWNEWAEGNHLEPDQKWGREYLRANLEGRRLGSASATGTQPVPARMPG